MYQDGLSFDYGLLGSEFTPDEMGRITSIMLKRNKISKNGEEELTDCIKVLKAEKAKTSLSLSDILNAKRNENK